MTDSTKLTSNKDAAGALAEAWQRAFEGQDAHAIDEKRFSEVTKDALRPFDVDVGEIGKLFDPLFRSPDRDQTFTNRFLRPAMGLSVPKRRQLAAGLREAVERGRNGIPTPRAIYAMLSEYVTGQEQAKRVLSVAGHKHLKCIRRIQDPDAPEIEKSNVLLVGPTGAGKTHVAKTLAHILGVPFVAVNATSYTAAGYMGDDVETMLAKALEAAEGNLELAQKALIFIDEIDKLAVKSHTHRDVGGEGVQSALLKILEGNIIDVKVPAPSETSKPEELTVTVLGMKKTIQFDTTNLLFICGGAFVGLPEIVEQRVAKESGVGFHNRPVARVIPSDTTLPDDLEVFGMKRELIGRTPVLAHLDALDLETLERILTEPKNALLPQFAASFAEDGVELGFTPEAVRRMAQHAQDLKTGGRGLRTAAEYVLARAQFEVPSLPNAVTMVVDETYARDPERAAPLIAFDNMTREGAARPAPPAEPPPVFKQREAPSQAAAPPVEVAFPTSRPEGVPEDLYRILQPTTMGNQHIPSLRIDKLDQWVAAATHRVGALSPETVMFILQHMPIISHYSIRGCQASIHAVSTTIGTAFLAADEHGPLEFETGVGTLLDLLRFGKAPMATTAAYKSLADLARTRLKELLDCNRAVDSNSGTAPFLKEIERTVEKLLDRWRPKRS
jgi:ATP-dependent Clp protease ATP-binding subunit ClpX